MPTPAHPIRLYRHPLSGHCHRVELFLSLLRLPYELVDVDLFKGAHKSTDFLAKNLFGQVPVIEDGDVTVADSNAILVYLALRYDASQRWLPRDPLGAAHVQRWLSVAAGQLASGPAAARLAALFKMPIDQDRAKGIATQLFGVLNEHLADHPFLASNAPTIADLAIYAYTAHAPEGNIALDSFPHVRAWLSRIESLDGFIAMQRSPAAA